MKDEGQRLGGRGLGLETGGGRATASPGSRGSGKALGLPLWGGQCQHQEQYHTVSREVPGLQLACQGVGADMVPLICLPFLPCVSTAYQRVGHKTGVS